jgi:hypothetical protein
MPQYRHSLKHLLVAECDLSNERLLRHGKLQFKRYAWRTSSSALTLVNGQPETAWCRHIIRSNTFAVQPSRFNGFLTQTKQASEFGPVWLRRLMFFFVLLPRTSSSLINRFSPPRARARDVHRDYRGPCGRVSDGIRAAVRRIRLSTPWPGADTKSPRRVQPLDVTALLSLYPVSETQASFGVADSA